MPNALPMQLGLYCPQCDRSVALTDITALDIPRRYVQNYAPDFVIGYCAADHMLRWERTLADKVRDSRN